MDTSTKTTGRVTPWNKDKLLGQKPPLKLKEIWAIRIRLHMNIRTRERALFNLAIDCKLRGCDLVGLRVHDVVQGSHVAGRAIVMQKEMSAIPALRGGDRRDRALDRGGVFYDALRGVDANLGVVNTRLVAVDVCAGAKTPPTGLAIACGRPAVCDHARNVARGGGACN